MISGVVALTFDRAKSLGNFSYMLGGKWEAVQITLALELNFFVNRIRQPLVEF